MRNAGAYCGQQTPNASISQNFILYFLVRICYMFSASKSRGECDVCLCTTSGLAKAMLLRGGDFRNIVRSNTCLNRKARHPAAAFFLKVLKLCTDLDRTLLYILILRTSIKFAQDSKTLALGVSFAQPCSSAGHTIPAYRSHLDTTIQLVRFHKKQIDEMRCKLDSTENPRSFEKYPTLKAQNDFSRKK